MKLKYHLTNKLFSSVLSNIVPGYIRKKLLKNQKIRFIPTKLNSLPQNNYPISPNINDQINVINKFSETQKEVTHKTYPELVNLLEKIYSENEKFNFLDFGGEEIDQYLILKKEFKNINYFVINKKEFNEIFDKLLKKYNYTNLSVLKNLNEILNHEYDFINFGSVLQYIDDYDFILEKILIKSKKYILISGIHLFKNDLLKNKYVVKQMNLWPKKPYLYFFNFNHFTEKFKKNNFKINFENKNESDEINYENFELEGINNTRYTDLLFKK